MLYLDHSFPDPAANLACDEALLAACDAGGPEVLRVWEPRQTFVALGYANHAATEARLDRCRQLGIPVLRRVTGGGTVAQMPGVLNYAVILRADRPETAGIAVTNRFVLDRLIAALRPLLPVAPHRAGDTDLCLGGRKCSGNAQRRRRRALLFHGALLLDADLAVIRDLLPFPSRAPDYRAGRAHEEFLVNLRLPPATVKQALRRIWRADAPLSELPEAALQRLVATRYARDDWNLRR